MSPCHYGRWCSSHLGRLQTVFCPLAIDISNTGTQSANWHLTSIHKQVGSLFSVTAHSRPAPQKTLAQILDLLIGSSYKLQQECCWITSFIQKKTIASQVPPPSVPHITGYSTVSVTTYFVIEIKCSLGTRTASAPQYHKPVFLKQCWYTYLQVQTAKITIFSPRLVYSLLIALIDTPFSLDLHCNLLLNSGARECCPFMLSFIAYMASTEARKFALLPALEQI